MFQKGDSIIEKRTGVRGGGIMFGVVMKVDLNPEILDVVFPTGRVYTFASHCQLYEEWLNENGF
jgi:hypothetical protein